MRAKKRHHHKKLSLTQKVIISTVFLGTFLSFFYFFLLKDLPSPTRLTSENIPQSSQIFDRNKTLLYTIYTQKNQTFIPLKSIPIHLQHAAIAIEDKDFYKHGAIDMRGIIRAFIATLFKGELQGGSTLTQQLVKNSLLTPERTITRKVKEVLLSFVVEMLYSKDQILEMYLNQSPFGGTAWGVEAASQTYFGKHVTDLTLAESALLAGLPESPTTYSPFGAYPKLAKQRQEEVLENMYKLKYITKNELDAAKKEPLQFQKVASTIKAPHFVLYVKDLLVKKYGEKKVEEGGLKVITSLDLPLQEFAQDAVATEVAKLQSQRVGNGAALITRPGTGEILAMVGSKDYFDTEHDGNVNVTIALRQPGSSIKPINYAVGLIKGYSASTPFVDQKVCFPNVASAPYCPVNYDGKFHGVMSMRQALGNSINIPAVKMLKLNTVEDMIATASAMGISTFKDPQRYGLSLTLGGGEVTMLELATAYGVFANSGYRVDLHPILQVTDKDGKKLEEYIPPKSPIFGKEVFSKAVAFIISDMLSDNGARELAFGSNSKLRIRNEKVAVKTGTTNDYRDNWTVGYTPQYLAAVWVGNNDNTPMGNLTSGVTGAAPIWNTLMNYLVAKEKPAWPLQPDTVVRVTVCAQSGLLPPTNGSCATKTEYFEKGKVPTLMDLGKQKIFVDKDTKDLAAKDKTDNLEEKEEYIITDPTGDRYCVTCPHPQLEEKTP